jgi:hypothetical protein
MSLNQLLVDQPDPQIAGSAVVMGDVHVGTGVILAQSRQFATIRRSVGTVPRPATRPVDRSDHCGTHGVEGRRCVLKPSPTPVAPGSAAGGRDRPFPRQRGRGRIRDLDASTQSASVTTFEPCLPCLRVRRPGDRRHLGPFAVDDLAGVAVQCRYPGRHADLSGRIAR